MPMGNRGYDQFTCCGAPETAAAVGCARIDHLPACVDLHCRGARDLIVPTYILHPGRSLTPGNTAYLDDWIKQESSLKQHLSRLVRRDSHYWATVPPDILKRARTRAQQKLLILEGTKQERSLTWTPHQPPPEAPLPLPPLAKEKKLEHEHAMLAANMLSMSTREALATRPLAVVNEDPEIALIAEELQSLPIAWSVVRVTQ